MKKSMIYTKTGDKGTTSLVGGTRVPKTHIRLEAYGTVDELNSYLGLLQTYLTDEEDKQIISLYKINYSLSVRIWQRIRHRPKLRMESRIEDEDIRMLEQAIDVIDNELPPLNAFILPGVTVEQPLDTFAGRCVAVPSDAFLHWLKNVT
jgi:PduO_Nterm: ATP:cob(I)alamin adenosyltransferase